MLRQPKTEKYGNVAFAHSSLEITFRQTCTADQSGKVETLKVNRCITTEDGCGLVTKGFVFFKLVKAIRLRRFS